MNTHPPLASVICNDRCIGFVLHRFDGFEAFDADQVSLGKFADEHDAVSAIFKSVNLTNSAGAP